MEHFRLEQVADDAWAAVALPETGAAGNAGFIRVGDFSIVFDTFASTAAADELRLSAEVIAPVAYTINSHWHADHVNGNRSFDDVASVATERTRELMEERAAGELDIVRCAATWRGCSTARRLRSKAGTSPKATRATSKRCAISNRTRGRAQPKLGDRRRPPWPAPTPARRRPAGRTACPSNAAARRAPWKP